MLVVTETEMITVTEEVVVAVISVILIEGGMDVLMLQSL